MKIIEENFFITPTKVLEDNVAKEQCKYIGNNLKVHLRMCYNCTFLITSSEENLGIKSDMYSILPFKMHKKKNENILPLYMCTECIKTKTIS